MPDNDESNGVELIGWPGLGIVELPQYADDAAVQASVEAEFARVGLVEEAVNGDDSNQND